MKLRLKILLILLPLTIVPLVSMGWIAYAELHSVSEQKAFEEMASTVENLARHAETELTTASANIELFAKHTMVRKYILTADESERYTLLQNPLLRAFTGFQDAFPEYYEIRIFLPDGYEDMRLTNREIDDITDEEAGNPVFQAMRKNGDGITKLIFRNPDNGEISLFIGKPLILRDPAIDSIGTKPSLRGYLAITLDLQGIKHTIRNQTIGKTGFLVATDHRGFPYFQPEGKPLGNGLPASVLETALSSSGRQPPVVGTVDKQPAYFTGAELFPGMKLFAVLPQTDLLVDSLKLAIIIAAITLLTIVLTTTGLYLALNHFIIRPVQNLRAISMEIGRGKLDIKNTLTSSDEIGDLATAFEDMASNLRRSDEQIRFIAYHDNLTGLPNRTMFREYLNGVLADARRHDKQFALLFLDIDDFKRVNDTLGHHAGDLLLQEVTERLSNCLRQADYVARLDNVGSPDEMLARLGGDEFVILLPDISGSHAPSKLADRLLAILSEPFSVEDHEFYIGASIGITLYPTDGKDAKTLTKNADIAMYHAKEQGKNDYQFYLQSMNVLAHERLALENKLRSALKNNELSLFYQPQVDTESGEIVGLEALVRWENPNEGRIPPGVFIPVAEETGLILSIGEWVINEACRQSHEWQKTGLPGIPVSVNVSGQQFGKQDLARIVSTALVRNKIAPNLLEIEITESAIMESPDRAVKDLAAIKALGVAIALDDFGTGYSSFSYLHRFPIDTLKIDRSFIHTIGTTKESSELVAAIIAMAHILHLRVVAEGIETQEQLGILAERDCDAIQGFLFQAPVPADQVPALLRRRRLRSA